MTEVIPTEAKTRFAVCAAGYAQQSLQPMQISAREVGWEIDGHGPAVELSAAHPGSTASHPLGEV